jgi:endoglucanase
MVKKLTYWPGVAATIVVFVVTSSCAPDDPVSVAAPSRVRTATHAVVRVNQVGYAADEPKRAYLMSTERVTGTFDVVLEGGGVVATAPIGSDLGAWSRRFPHVYALAFDVTDPGSYRVAVDAPAPILSPVFDIGDPLDLFAPLLSNALTFYQAQRDGPNVIGSVLQREPSHLNDQTARVFERAHYTPDFTIVNPEPVPSAARRDVSGGWFDAGDYIKGVMTESYAASMLLVARRDFPDELGSGSDADFTGELAFELRWLLRMWDDDTHTLLYQVGFGDGSDRWAGDHDPWRLPQEDDTYRVGERRYRYIRHRPAFRAGPPGSPISPNLAGRIAAAFGLCSQVYRATSPTLADRCLESGQHIFDLADRRPHRLLTFSPFAFYPETEWHSDLELGAVELAVATSDPAVPQDLPHANPRYYLERSARWAERYLGGHELGDTLNLYDVSALAHAELAQAIDSFGATGLAVDRDQLVADIERQLRDGARQASKDPYGFGFPYDEYDGTSHGQGLAITAGLHRELTGSDRWAGFGRRQLDVILGSNPWGTSFIVGAGDTFPRCPHHQVANLVGSLSGSPPVLLGAAVNGTNGKDQFAFLGLPEGARRCPPGGTDRFARFNGRGARWWDNAKSWPTSEPAIDFSATTPLAFAMQMEPA